MSSSRSDDQVRAAQVEQVRARARRRVGDEPAGQPVEDPVAEHAHVGDRVEDLGLVLADPQEAGRRGDGHPVAADLEDPARITAADELGRLRRLARESTFGQAQISRPAASYRTMPSRMLVLLTAAMSRRAEPGPRERLADALADEPPVPFRVEDLGAWDAGHGGMRPLALTDGRPAARRDRTSTARQLPVPRSMASRWAIRRPSPSTRSEPGPVGQIDQRLAAREPLDLGRRHLAAVMERLVGGAADVGRDDDVGNARSGCRPASGDGLTTSSATPAKVAAGEAVDRAPPRRRACPGRC